MPEIKTKKQPITCRRCKQKFEPLYRNGILMSKYCISCLAEKGKKEIKRQWVKDKKAIKEKLKTQSDWLNDLQKVFNEFIRLRDRGQPCISCGCKIIRKGNASHFFSVGSYPNLRFNEDNVHLSCIECNLHKHGNILEYSNRLPLRIGKEKYNILLESKNKPLNLSIPEIKDLITHYKEKINELKQQL